MSILSLFGHTSDYNAYTPGYNTYSSASGTLSNEDAAGVMLVILLFTLVAAVISYVVVALSLSSIFKKAGVESWKAWVPIYNMWIMLELGGQQGYWAVLAVIPVVNIVAAVFMYIAMYHIGLKFGKQGTFVLFAIFLPLVWYIWLAVDKSTWHGGAPVAATSQTGTTPISKPPTPPPAA